MSTVNSAHEAVRDQNTPDSSCEVRRVCSKILAGRPFELDGDILFGSRRSQGYVALATQRPDGPPCINRGQLRLFRLTALIHAGLVHLVDDERRAATGNVN